MRRQIEGPHRQEFCDDEVFLRERLLSTLRSNSASVSPPPRFFFASHPPVYVCSFSLCELNGSFA
ncbi:unnamed protein product [Mesocestoides corti]|uniref:Uncharacterized protein n=1 Tax=Mesocestoides corti TaxID=53468 RepID=A0A0R3U416_MESCO|nr:unnamed protein product [Mesocestoides corti]